MTSTSTPETTETESVETEGGVSDADRVVLDQAESALASSRVSAARTEFMATGTPSAEARLRDVEEELGDSVQTPPVVNSVLSNFPPNILGSQTSQFDTSGLSGRSDAASVVDAAVVFGHPTQQAVAKTATQSAPDSSTVVTTIVQDPAAKREEVLRAAGVVSES